MTKARARLERAEDTFCAVLATDEELESDDVGKKGGWGEGEVAEDARTEVWMVGMDVVFDGEMKEGGNEGEEGLKFEGESGSIQRVGRRKFDVEVPER